MGPELMEMRRLQKALPPRPSFSQLEWALSTIGRVNSNLAVRRDELGRQPRPVGVPASVFEALQEMRKEVLEEEAYQQRQQAEAISRLEQRHRLYDAWIQLAYDALSSSLSLTTSSSPPTHVVTAAPGSVIPPSHAAPAPIAASAGEGVSLKSASDTKRDLFPSEGSTTSATQLSSAVPAPATAADDDQADTPLSMHRPLVEDVVDLPRRPSPDRELKHCSSDRRGCNWSEHETFLLIDGKRKLAQEMRNSPSSALFKSKQQRWEFVAGFLENLRVHKSWQQCVYRWNRLWKPFKTIHGYESIIVSKHISYWKLSPSERVDKRLPRNYSAKVFEVLKQNFVVDRSALSNTTVDASSLPLKVCKDEGMEKSIEKDDSDVDVSPRLNELECSPSKEKKNVKKRRNSGWLDDMRKDPMLHRFTVTPGVRLSSCMLAAWDF